MIPGGLKALGAEVDEVAVYRNVPPPLSAEQFRDILAGSGADAVTFSSGSTVKNFTALFPGGEAPGLLEGVVVACIGPVTADAAREKGLKVDVMPEEYTLAALADALEGYYENRQARQA